MTSDKIWDKFAAAHRAKNELSTVKLYTVQPKIQPYRWVQNVFSLFENGGIEIIVGTTSNCDRYHGLTELIEKHLFELTVRRRGLQPKQTWIGFTSSDGETLVQTLEDYMSQERP